MQVFTHDLNVGALAGQGFFGVLGYLHAVRVVLAQDVDLFNVFLGFHEARHGFHLHGGVGIKTEVPVAAFAIGQVGVYRRVIEVDHLFAGVAFVVFGHCIGKRQGHRRAIALDDVTHATVDSSLERRQALGGAELVVDASDFKFDTCGVARATEFFGKKLVAFELAHTHRAQQTRLRINAHHLYDLALLSKAGTSTGQCNTSHHEFQSELHFVSC